MSNPIFGTEELTPAERREKRDAWFAQMIARALPTESTFTGQRIFLGPMQIQERILFLPQHHAHEMKKIFTDANTKMIEEEREATRIHQIYWRKVMTELRTNSLRWHWSTQNFQI